MEFINNPKLVLAIKLLLSLVFSFVLVWSLKFFTHQRKNSFNNFFLFVVLGSLLGFLSAVVYNLFPLLLIVVFLTYGGFLFLFLNKDYSGFLLSLLSFLLGILTAQGFTFLSALTVVVVGYLIASFVEAKLFMPLSEVMLPFILLTLGLGLVFYRQLKEKENPLPNKGVKLKNPLGFVESLEFALIYSLITVGAYLAKEKFGNGAIYLLAFSSGIVDVDPLTLSLSKMVSEGLLNINTAVVGIVIAVVSNNFFKALYAYIFGSSEIKRLVSLLVVLNLAYAGIVYWFLK